MIMRYATFKRIAIVFIMVFLWQQAVYADALRPVSSGERRPGHAAAAIETISYNPVSQKLVVNGMEANMPDYGFGSYNNIYVHPQDPSLVIRLNRVDRELDRDEIKNFERYSNPSIGISPAVISYGTTPENNPYIVVERIYGVTLEDLERRGEALSPTGIRHMKALFHILVENKILLLDFRPANVMLGTTASSNVPQAWLPDVKRAEQKKWLYRTRRVARYYLEAMQRDAYRENWPRLDPKRELIRYLQEFINSGRWPEGEIDGPLEVSRAVETQA